MAPFLNKFRIMPIVCHQPTDHAETNSGVGAWFWLKPEIGEARYPGPGWVDYDNLRALSLRPLEGQPLCRVGGNWVAADNESAVGIVNILAVGNC